MKWFKSLFLKTRALENSYCIFKNQTKTSLLGRDDLILLWTWLDDLIVDAFRHTTPFIPRMPNVCPMFGKHSTSRTLFVWREHCLSANQWHWSNCVSNSDQEFSMWDSSKPLWNSEFFLKKDDLVSLTIHYRVYKLLNLEHSIEVADLMWPTCVPQPNLPQSI